MLIVKASGRSSGMLFVDVPAVVGEEECVEAGRVEGQSGRPGGIHSPHGGRDARVAHSERDPEPRTCPT